MMLPDLRKTIERMLVYEVASIMSLPFATLIFESVPFFFNDTATTEIYPLSLHDALPISTPNAPTGTVFNGTGDFVVTNGALSGPARFLFAHEGGTISGWNPTASPTSALTAVDKAPLVTTRSEEHTSELQSPDHLVSRLLL